MKTKIRSTFDAGLYERCINLAIKLSETEIVHGNNFGQVGYGQQLQIKTPKYNSDEIFKLADKLYAKIKGEK